MCSHEQWVSPVRNGQRVAERHNLGGGWVNYDFQQPLGAVATMPPLLAAFGFGTV